ncbi:hypothetical protein WJX75_001687 [Coccomyxa subellipsoidea]|uniref:Uncharacterized protein n=1 Tax=Coccomyxa subellipsoidea TaxID=248742 RepID=A0ABR2YFX9_9CHLO
MAGRSDRLPSSHTLSAEE